MNANQLFRLVFPLMGVRAMFTIASRFCLLLGSSLAAAHTNKIHFELVHSFPIGKDPIAAVAFHPDAVAATENGRALPALSLGRSLWYYEVQSWLVNSRDYSADAYDLLKRVYTLLDRPALLRVLELHFAQRDLESVDLLRS